MRFRCATLVTCVAALGFASAALAQEDVKAVLEKAVKAHGGKENLAKMSMLNSKSKGTIDLFGGLNFEQESTSNLPKQFKETIALEIAGSKQTIITVFDDGKAWANINGVTNDVDEKTTQEIKQASNLMQLGSLRFVDNKDYTVTPLGESKVDGKAVVGVKVARHGFRDASLFFSKETGLLSKIENQTYDTATMRDTPEERLILDYQDVGGAKVAKKVLVRRNGKKFMEAEVTEVKVLDKVAPDEFAKP
jgi:hypothetical protein